MTGDYSSNLLKKWRVNTKVFGHNVETEEVPVNTRTSHGQTIHVLMLLCRLPKQSKSLGILITKTQKNSIQARTYGINVTSE